jgi:putative ABC transport system permease protein
LTEGIILAAAGAIAGTVFGAFSLRALVALRPAALTRISSARMDTTVFLLIGAAGLLWGLLFSLAQMIEVIRTNIAGRVLGNMKLSPAGRHRTRKALVTLQIAFSVLLLVGAGLMIRTFVAIQHLDPGYNWEHALSFRLSPPLDVGDSAAAVNAFHERLQGNLAAVPGVAGVGAVSHLPFDNIPNWGNPYFIAAGQDPTTAPFADFRSVSPGYLETIGAHLVEGRFFTEADRDGSQPVVIVDDLRAKKSWPGETAIGKKIAVAAL